MKILLNTLLFTAAILFTVGCIQESHRVTEDATSVSEVRPPEIAIEIAQTIDTLTVQN